MFALSVAFGPTNNMVSFLFKTEEAGRKQQTHVSFEPEIGFTIVDDFGQEGTFRGADVHSVMFEDLSQSSAAHIERHLHNLRMQAKADEIANADSGLRAANMKAKLAAMNSGHMSHPGPLPRA